jgi:hypothetical protein
MAELSPEAAFEAGWCMAARWARRADLISDIGSEAYVSERAEALAAQEALERAARRPITGETA